MTAFGRLNPIGWVCAASMIASLPAAAASVEVQGAGSTFVAPMIAKWADEFAKQSGTKVAYDSVGSGAGIARIEAGTVDFGASDKPLSPNELAKHGLFQFPIVVGAVVPVANLPGVGQGRLKFSGALLADIYQGKVTRWNDPAIRKLNPDVGLPPLPIKVVHRSDGSGTTFNWVDFLSKSSADWKRKIGSGLTVNWPVGAGANGNDGVAAAVLQTPGAIGYVEYSIALRNKMAYAQVQNTFGLYVPPSVDSFEAAADTVDWKLYPDFSAVMTDAGGAAAYPITSASFVIMYRTPKDPSRASAALRFFKWALEDGGSDVAELKYVPLPPSLIVRIETYWKSHMVLEHNTSAAR